MSTGNFFAEKLDWLASGYHAQPTPPDDPNRSNHRLAKAWEAVEEIVQLAKRGDFRRTEELIEIYSTGDVLLKFVCCKALGDVGGRSCFARLVESAQEDFDPEKTMNFVRALHEWGSLSVVPIILGQYYK